MNNRGSTARVFVTQENPGLDYTPAEKFGDIVFLTKDDVSPIQKSLRNRAIVDEIRHKLQAYQPNFDYIITSGSPAVAAVVFMLLHEKTQNLRFLRWSNRDREYTPIILSLNTD